MAVSPQPALYPTGNDAATSAAIALLIHYFDLAPASAQLLVKKWLTNYPAIWVRAAVTEALYQGRYKPFSVEQILAFWQRRGKSIPHFNKEFETIIAVPLQGSFKTETDVAIEGNEQLESGGVASAVTEAGEISAIAIEPALAPSTTLAEALEAAEQEQSDTDTPLPRPRLMLPGELPGKGLAQRNSAVQGSATQDNASETSTTSTQRSASEPQLPGASALSQPQGFDGVLDPRPRPQVTQGPDSALVAETKSKQIQPPPIGRFTPAADPSGFASRLKTVVEQAIAKTQTKEEQLSLETAIASQLASDPVLGQPRAEEAPAEPESDESSALRVEAMAVTEVPPTQLPEAAELEESVELEKAVELEATADLGATTSSVAPADVEVPTLLNLEVQTVEEEAQPEADVAVRESDPWEADAITEAEATAAEATEAEVMPDADVISEPEVLSPEPVVSLNEEAIASLLASQEQAPEPDLPEAEEASALNETVADSPAPSQAEMVDAIAEEPSSESSEESVEAPPELTAPFEERFPLTNANEPQELSSPTRDAIDIELDNRLIETRMDEEPQISLTPADNDRLDLVFESEPESKQEPRSRLEEAIEADEADLLALGGESQLLNDDALTRHLETGFDGGTLDDSRPDEASDAIAANVTGTDGASIAAADFPAKDFPANTDALLEAADPSAAQAVNPEGESLELGSGLDSTSPEVPQPAAAAEPLPENAQEISQVSNLMAGLTQLHNANSYPESFLPGIGAMQPEQLGEDSNEADSDADNGQSDT